MPGRIAVFPSAVQKTERLHPSDYHGLPSRGNPPQLSAMRATGGPADHHSVAFPCAGGSPGDTVNDTVPSDVSRPGRVADMDGGLAALHALVSVTMGAKSRNAPLSLSCSRRPQHSLGRDTVPICNTTNMPSTTLQHLRQREPPCRHRRSLRARLACLPAKLWHDLLTQQAE